MRRPLAAVLALGLSAAVAAAVAPGAAASVRVKSTDVASYPTVRMTVVTSKQSQAVPTIREDGRRVAGLRASNLGGPKSIVLAVDRSHSMRGSLEDAVAAARAFVAAKAPRDRIAVMSFSSTAERVSSFSIDRVDADLALRSLRVDGREGTALNDTVVVATRDLLADGRPPVLVLLTDGRDVASLSSQREALRAARRAGIAVYAIGIETPQFSPRFLERLAHATGGSYYGVSTAEELLPLYRSLSRELRRTWRFEYATAARAGETVQITASVRGETGHATVRTPGRRTPPTIAQPSPLIPAAAYDNPWSPLALGVAVGLILLGCVLVATRPSRSEWARQRVLAHVRERPRKQPAETEDRRLPALGPLFSATEDAFGRFKLWRRVERLLERADLGVRAPEFLYIVIGCAFAAAFVAAFTGQPTFVIVVAYALGAAAPFGFASFKAKRRAKAFETLLPDVMLTIAGSLKAGHSFRQGLQGVVNDGGEPASKEFQRVLAETRLGRPMDDALKDMAKRSGSKNLEFMVAAVTIQQQVGGSLAGLFEMVADTVRARQQFARKIKGLTAMGRASAWTLLGLPFFIAITTTVMNPEYMGVLYGTPTGRMLILAGLVSMGFGALVLKKIVSFRT